MTTTSVTRPPTGVAPPGGKMPPGQGAQPGMPGQPTSNSDAFGLLARGMPGGGASAAPGGDRFQNFEGRVPEGGFQPWRPGMSFGDLTGQPGGGDRLSMQPMPFRGAPPTGATYPGGGRDFMDRSGPTNFLGRVPVGGLGGTPDSRYGPNAGDFMYRPGGGYSDTGMRRLDTRDQRNAFTPDQLKAFVGSVPGGQPAGDPQAAARAIFANNPNFMAENPGGQGVPGGIGQISAQPMPGYRPPSGGPGQIPFDGSSVERSPDGSMFRGRDPITGEWGQWFPDNPVSAQPMPATGGPSGTVTPGSRPGMPPQSAPPGFPGQPSVPPGPGGSVTPNDPFSRPTSAMDVYRSSVPAMEEAMKTAVGGAMGEAGFTGNRFGSYAMDRAAQEGSKAGLEQNRLMSDLLYRQTNADQDRALQAAGLGMQHGISQNQMELDRMRFLADQGRWEQDRQDRYGMLSYQDFENNKLGFLPFLAQLAQAPGTATSGVWGNQQSGGSPGALDYFAAIAPILAAFASDERLKEDIQPFDRSADILEKLRPRSWRWKATGAKDDGFVAQEVAVIAPEMVVPIDTEGHLGLSVTGLLALVVENLQTLVRRVEVLEAR